MAGGWAAAAKKTAPFAKRIAQNSADQGYARTALKYRGSAYEPGRGFREQVPARTQAQAAVWGNEGPIGTTKYSGFGELKLDRGMRVHAKPQFGDIEPDKEDAPSLAGDQFSNFHAGNVKHTPQRPMGLGSVIEATATESPSSGSSSTLPWETGPVGSTSDFSFDPSAAMATAAKFGTAANDKLNSTLSRPVMGRVVKAGMKATPMGRAALFANSAINKRG